MGYSPGMSRKKRPDPVRLEVFHHLLAAVCEESGALLQRSAISPNIRERRDFSCALFDAEGRLVAQAAHIPVHLGSAADSVVAVREALCLGRGDVAILNDPYAGGTHLPDVTMVRPVFVGKRKEPEFFVVNRAHHADIGGAVAGSMAVMEDLLAEGLVIPPVKFREAGERVAAVSAILRANVRGADERMIDFQAQESALALADERLQSLVSEYSLRTVREYCSFLMDYSESIVRDVLRALPRGSFTAEDVMEDDGLGGGPFPLRLELGIRPKCMTFDFRASAQQARGGINANRSIVTAAAMYVLRCLCPERLPTNDGLFRVLKVLTKPGTMLEPRPGAPVAGGNVETSQRLVDLGLSALARVLPERIPAASAGTMSNLSLGGCGDRSFAFYETLPGGAGGSSLRAGSSALQTHMTNTRNTPVEELEYRYPVRVKALSVRRRSGGAGAKPGGDGLVKEIEVLEDATLSLFCERQVNGPRGVCGGEAGKAGRTTMTRGGRRKKVPAKTSMRLAPGDTVRVETPGGGGYGKVRRSR